MTLLTLPPSLSWLTKQAVLKAAIWSIAYAGISTFLINYFSGEVGESPIWLPAGIGLGVLITLGWRYWPFIFVGATIGELGGGHQLFMAMQLAAGSVIGFLMATFILKRYWIIDINLESVGEYTCFLGISAIAALISTSLNIQFLIWGGLIPLDHLFPIYLKWFTGDFFGMAFIAPILLIFNKPWIASWSKKRVFWLVVILLASFCIGQGVFFGWFKEYVDITNKGNLYLILILLIGINFGRHGAILLFSLLLVQSVLGGYSGEGFVGQDLMTRPGPVTIEIYLALASIMGLMIGLTVEKFKRKNETILLALNSLETSEDRFRQVVVNTPVLIAIFNLQLQVINFVNPYFTQVLGYITADLASPKSLWALAYRDPSYSKEVETEWFKRVNDARNTHTPFVPFDMQTHCKDGSVKIINWGCFFSSEQMVIYGIDVTEQRHAVEVLMVSSAVYEAMGEAVVIKDAKNAIVMANAAFEELTGFTSKDIVGKSFSDLLVKRHGARSYLDIFTSLEATGRWEGQAWIRLKNGEESLRFMSIYSSFDEQGLAQQRVALISEVTDQRKARELINQQANFDPLTGLPNRRLMLDRLEQLIKQSARSQKSIAIAYIDLDNFKDINDVQGHDFGDQLLKGVASRLRLLVRETDTVSRVGGDEFVILLSDLDRPEAADLIIQEISKKLTDPIEIEGQRIFITASMGISLYPNDGDNSKNLLLCADQAMYAAKAQDRNTYQYFTQSLQIKASYRAGIVAELRVGLEKGQFELYYQPIVNLKTGKTVHAEALLRWRRSNGELALPSSFIQIAEESGFIVEIGNWVWKEAITFLSTVQSRPNFKLAINVAASQFNSSQHSAVGWLDLLSQYGISPDLIILEITERTILIKSQRVLRKIKMLQESGCLFGVDDFGIGYSSLASLKGLDFDYVKIDMEFIKTLTAGSTDATLVFAIIAMAKGLGMESIAEGIETLEQVQLLNGMNCMYGQGYLYSKPLSADAFKQFLLAEQLIP